jgi:dihydroflavonol-4-reductase
MATAQAGQPPPKLIPYKLAYAIAWAAEKFMKLTGRKDYLVSTDAITLSNIFRELDNGKARRELGWSPRPLAETVRDTIAWFAAQQHPPLERNIP